MFKKSCSELVLSVFILGLGLFQYLYAQGPDTLWTKTFGGGDNDYGYSVQQTTDGGYIIAGCTYSFGAGGGDVWLIKTDDSGDTLWTKTYGGSSYDYAYCVQQTTDDGYIMTGMTEFDDVWLIKTNASGDTLWTKTFGSVDIDAGNCVQQTSDGGYIITGYTYHLGPDVWLIKTNASGDTIWTKTFGGSDTDNGISVQQTADGGYIITGYTESFGAGNADVWLIKTNASGDTIWTKTFGGSDWDEGLSVQQTTDQGYIIAGCYGSFSEADVWLIKTDASGDTIWTKIFLFGAGVDLGYSVQQIADGGYIMTGRTFGASASDVLLIRTDDLGDTLWVKTFGGSTSDDGYSVQQTNDGGYIITGYTASFGAGGCDVWLIKTGPEPGIVEHDDQSIISGNCVLNQNYPNPFNTMTNISYSISHPDFIALTVYDVLGREVKTLVNRFKNEGTYFVTFDATELSSGLYCYELRVAGRIVETKKMLLLR